MTVWIRRAIAIASGELVLMLAASAWAWTRLDAHARVAVHWNATLHADRYGGRAEALFTLPLVLAAGLVVFAAAAMIRRRSEGSRKSKAMVFVSVATLFAFLHGAAVASAVNGSSSLSGPIVSGTLATALLVLGNYMPKSQRNWWFGLRTPWALADDRTWQATQRFGGVATLSIGVVMWVVILAGEASAAFVVGLIGLVAVALAGTLYSYRLSRR